MALLKVLKGQEANLPTTINEGYIYFTTDSGKIYLDISNTERIEISNTGAGAKLDMNNPTGTGSFSLNRKVNTAIGNNSFVEGMGNTASSMSSHAEGLGTTASGSVSHAEGAQTIASGIDSHAEGLNTVASGVAAHAQGVNTQATGERSHAEGFYTHAQGSMSHASGEYTIAAGVDQMAIGKYNISDTTSAFIIGNGTSDSARANAYKIDFSGNSTQAGNIVAGGDVSSKTYSLETIGKTVTDYIKPIITAQTIGSTSSGSATSFTIPYVTIDAYGRVTGGGNRTQTVPQLAPFVKGTTAPSNTSQFWIDTTATTGGLKYHNGSAWVTVPVRYS